MSEGLPPSSPRRPSLAGALTGLGQRLRPSTGVSGMMPVSTRLSTWVGIVSAITGGFLGLKTWREDVDKQVDERVAKTFAMVERFQSGDLQGLRTRVLSYVQARRQCDARLIADGLVDDDFVRVIDFFDLVDACVKADLCDRAVTARFFAPYANHQQPILAKVVETLRAAPQSVRADAGFGDGLTALASAPMLVPPCDGNF